MTPFVGSGTALNLLTILLGGAVGLLLGSRLPERVRLVAMDALGLGTLAIGVLSLLDVADPALTESVGPAAAVVVIGAALLGGIIGALLRVEDRLEHLGHLLRAVLRRSAPRRAPGADDGAGEARFIEGFVTASLVFCVGPLAVLGPINDGLGRGIDELAVKSLLDGVAAAAFASALGTGVLLSVVPVLVVQGAFTVVGVALGDLLDTAQIAALSATGGLLLLGVGFRLLRLRDVPVGDLLPALVVAPALVATIQAVTG